MLKNLLSQDGCVGSGETQPDSAVAADNIVNRVTADALAMLDIDFCDATSFMSDTMRSWSTIHVSSDVEAFFN